MKIDVITALDSDDVDRFHDIYAAAFEPMQTLAAARHLLTRDEFAEDMADPRIDKWVAYEDDRIIGLTTMTTDPAAFPWISPLFYANRYPDHVATGRLFYLGYILVDPRARRTHGVFQALSGAVLNHCNDRQAIMCFDTSDYSTRGAVGQMVKRLPKTYGARVDIIDTQTYFAADFGAAQSGGEPA